MNKQELVKTEPQIHSPPKEGEWYYGVYSRTECKPFRAIFSCTDTDMLVKKALVMAFNQPCIIADSGKLIECDAIGYQVKDELDNVIVDIETTAFGRVLLENVCQKLILARHPQIRDWASEESLEYLYQTGCPVQDDDVARVLKRLFFPKIEPGYYCFDKDYEIWSKFLDFSYIRPEVDRTLDSLPKLIC